MTKKKQISIEFADEFQKRVRKLFKKYRSIKQDLTPIIQQLQNGETLGDRLSGVDNNAIYKVRVKNSDIKKGKSAGYRVLYLLKKETKIILLTIYSKSEQANISAKELLSILQDFYGE
ncbi:type II toxin-antitoxin system RelE/ParE family toxin [Synechococcus sp. BDU 130192]|uniref:type II toxin-antitoxin system RelE/ParE family toxin n=1 Tax=Synechococcus sp. BDU 130192 TaxID=2042059 RepID=UPI000C069CFF|nr:type II toxin-antitoxin system RelE/ParE family toxin [Synechococcus sp. BDU 130192]